MLKYFKIKMVCILVVACVKYIEVLFLSIRKILNNFSFVILQCRLSSCCDHWYYGFEQVESVGN